MTCNVPNCNRDRHARALCGKHYRWWRKGDPYVTRYSVESQNVEYYVCTCPVQRHDDWECPTCRRPSFSAERIAQFTP